MSQPRNLDHCQFDGQIAAEDASASGASASPGGYLIISGIIEADVPAMEEHFMVAPLVQYRRLTEKEWVCCVLRKEKQRTILTLPGGRPIILTEKGPLHNSIFLDSREAGIQENT